jgi:phospholipid/cholesterol/gamma-HCH transport system substrate-binding protein
MTIARAAALGALVVVLAIVAVVVLGGGGGEQYRLVFENAGQLVSGNDVQIGGRRIGNVDDITLTDDNRAEIKITVERPYAPLHEGTTATIRLASLSGVANRYISLSPGPNNAPRLRAGATLGTEHTTSVVDIDQLFNTFDARTRKGLQDVFKGGAAQYAGKAPEVNASAKYFNPAISTTTDLVREIARDRTTLEAAIVNTASVMTSIAQRRDDLSSLIGNASTMMGAIARENAGLTQAVDVLPGTLREANSTFRDVRSALDDLDPLVDASKPATRNLARFFREFRPLVDEATPTFTNLSTFVSQPGAADDATDIMRMLPRLQQVGSPAFKSSLKAMRAGQPVVDFLRPYAPDFAGWLRSFGASAANYDANGHYVRALPIFGAFQFQQGSDGSQSLQPVSPAQRLEGLRATATRRCPGSASQPRPDGSNPWLAAGGDCAQDEVPPGP